MVSRSNIQEANKHLHAMHLHSTYLENSLQECQEIIKQNEERYCNQIQNLRKEKDEKIAELLKKLKHLEDNKVTLEKHLQDKEKEIRLLKGRLSVFKQIFQFLPGLKSFVGVIENARQLVKSSDNDIDKFPNDSNVQSLNMDVSSIAKHNIPSTKSENLSVSEDSDDEKPCNDTDRKVVNGHVRSHSLSDKSTEVFL